MHSVHIEMRQVWTPVEGTVMTSPRTRISELVESMTY